MWETWMKMRWMIFTVTLQVVRPPLPYQLSKVRLLQGLRFVSFFWGGGFKVCLACPLINNPNGSQSFFQPRELTSSRLTGTPRLNGRQARSSVRTKSRMLLMSTETRSTYQIFFLHWKHMFVHSALFARLVHLVLDLHIKLEMQKVSRKLYILCFRLLSLFCDRTIQENFMKFSSHFLISNF